jgi:hypothetical protein
MIADHAIIGIDTIALSGHPESDSYKNAKNFLSNLRTLETPPSKRIMLTHVPLFRPDDSECGSRRVSGPLRNFGGYQFQSKFSSKLRHDSISNSQTSARDDSAQSCHIRYLPLI